MANISSQPTVNTSPDPAQGGSAIGTASNTGHTTTSTNASNGASLTRSCVWTTFQSVAGTISSLNLKAAWSIDGLLEAAGVNEFRFQYTVDGGSNWITTEIRSDVVASASGSENISLSAAQDISLVQMRVRYVASADIGAGVDAQISGAISGIQIDAVTVDNPVGGMVVLM